MHIGIILDGNGRWATKRGLPRTMGHKKGMTKVIETIEWANNNNIDILTLYAFSTENWKRPAEEVEFLMDLLLYYIDLELNNLHKKNATINIFGDIGGLPLKVQKKLLYAVDLTKNNTGLIVNFAINYSSLSELDMALKHIINDFSRGKISKEDIDVHLLKEYLYTKSMPDPDIILRTGGEKRLSNFLLVQSAYSELIFIDELWPDINDFIMDKVMEEYNKRDRRFGGIK